MAYEYYITPAEYDIAAQNGISKVRLEERVRRLAWPKEKAITQPIRPKRSYPMVSAAVSRKRFCERLRNGWTLERAAATPVLSWAEACRLARTGKEVN